MDGVNFNFSYSVDTQPRYERRDVATRVCEWGMARAKGEGRAVRLERWEKGCKQILWRKTADVQAEVTR